MTTSYFFVLLPFIYTEIKNWEEKQQKFNVFINTRDGLSPLQFEGVHMKDFQKFEDRLHLKLFP